MIILLAAAVLVTGLAEKEEEEEEDDDDDNDDDDNDTASDTLKEGARGGLKNDWGTLAEPGAKAENLRLGVGSFLVGMASLHSSPTSLVCIATGGLRAMRAAALPTIPYSFASGPAWTKEEEEEGEEEGGSNCRRKSRNWKDLERSSSKVSNSKDSLRAATSHSLILPLLLLLLLLLFSRID
jgi:hypothetical protein